MIPWVKSADSSLWKQQDLFSSLGKAGREEGNFSHTSEAANYEEMSCKSMSIMNWRIILITCVCALFFIMCALKIKKKFNHNKREN
jgi:hypothetical protein